MSINLIEPIFITELIEVLYKFLLCVPTSISRIVQKNFFVLKKPKY